MHISLVKPTCFSSVLQRFIREKWLEFFQRQLSLASRLASHTALDYATNVENVVYYIYLSKCIYFIIAGAMCKCITIGKCLCTMTEVCIHKYLLFFPKFLSQEYSSVLVRQQQHSWCCGFNTPDFGLR